MATINEIMASEWAAAEFVAGNRYLLKGWKVYQVNYSPNYNNGTHLAAMELYKSTHSVPLVNRGRIMMVGGDFVNNLLGFELVNN